MMVALPISDFDTTSIQQVTLTPAGYYRLYGDAPEPLKVVHPSDPLAASIAVLIDRWDWRQDWIGKHYRRPIIIPFVRIPSTLYILPAPKPAPKPDDDFDEQSPAAAYRGIKRTVIKRIGTVIPEQSFTLFEEDVKAGLVGVRFDDILTGPQAHKIRRAGIAFTEISEGRHVAVVKLATLPIVEPAAVKVAPKSEPLPCDVPAMRYMVEYRGHAAIATADSLDDVISGLTGKPRGMRPEHVHVRTATDAERVGKFALKATVRIPLGQRVAKVEAISYRMGATVAEDVYWYAVELLPGQGRKWYREDQLEAVK